MHRQTTAPIHLTLALLLCLPACRSVTSIGLLPTAPTITDVRGTGSANDRVTNTLVIVGTNLSDASVKLFDSAGNFLSSLVISTASASELSVALPATLAEGSYQIEATTSAGTVRQTFGLLKGEPGATGPTGTAGTNGANGLAGPTGPAGASGSFSTGTLIVRTLSAANTTYLAVACADGEYAISGGCWSYGATTTPITMSMPCANINTATNNCSSSYADGAAVAASTAATRVGWACRAQTTTTGLDAYVVCAK